MIGTIVEYNTLTGCGFITSGSMRYFVNKKSFQPEQQSFIQAGRKVNFSVGKGTKAVKVTLLNAKSGKASRFDSIVKGN